MKRVLVLGGVSYNTMIYIDGFPTAEPQTVFSRRLNDTIGSTGSGKALNLNKLGFDVTLHGVIGDDEQGVKIKSYFSDEGLRFIHDVNPAGTERHANLMDPDGRRLSIINVPGPVDPALLDHAKIELFLDDSDYVALSITSPYASLIPLIKEHDKEIWCDLHDYNRLNPYHLPFIQASEYLFLSSDSMPEYRAFMERATAAGKKLVVCTHGKAGSTARTQDGRWIETPAIPQPFLADTNGAGDAFFAGFLYGHSQGYPLDDCLRYATIAGGLCTMSDELAIPLFSPAIIEAEYQKHYRSY